MLQKNRTKTKTKLKEKFFNHAKNRFYPNLHWLVTLNKSFSLSIVVASKIISFGVLKHLVFHIGSGVENMKHNFQNRVCKYFSVFFFPGVLRPQKP